jgi:hypothetical protein
LPLAFGQRLGQRYGRILVDRRGGKR